MQFKASSDYSQKPTDTRLEGERGLVGSPIGGGKGLMSRPTGEGEVL